MHNQKFDDVTIKKLNKMLDLVDSSLAAMNTNLKLGYTQISGISNAQDAEHDINEYRDNLKEEHLRNIESEESAYLLGVYYMDLVTEMERVGDYIINVSEAIIEIN